MHFELTLSHDDPITVTTLEKNSPNILCSVAGRRKRKIVSNEMYCVHIIFHLGGLNTCNNERMAFSKAQRNKKSKEVNINSSIQM